MSRKKQRQQETGTNSNLFKVTEVREVEPGKRKVVLVNCKVIALFNINSEIYAINNRCPHAEFSLGAGLIYEDMVICPGHAWTFKLKTGECITKKSRPVKTYKVVIEGKDIKIQL